MKNSLILLFCFGLLEGSDLEKWLSLAGNNRSEIEQAITEIPDEQYRGMEWLITHMPDEDIKTLSAEFLINNCSLAYEAWKNSPWVSGFQKTYFLTRFYPMRI